MRSASFYFHNGVTDVRRVWETFKAFLKEMRANGGAEVIVKPFKKNKTDQQRKYAHMCIGIIAKEVGDNPKHLKYDIKERLGLIDEIERDGRTLQIEISTEDLNRDEYGRFIQAIKTLAANLEIILPDPTWFGMEAA